MDHDISISNKFGLTNSQISRFGHKEINQKGEREREKRRANSLFLCSVLCSVC